MSPFGLSVPPASLPRLPLLQGSNVSLGPAVRSLVIFLLCHKERVLETQLSLEVSAGIALGIGLLCGLVTMLVRSVGLFLTGLLLGLTLGAGALLGTEP